MCQCGTFRCTAAFELACDKTAAKQAKLSIRDLKKARNAVQKQAKAEMDRHAYFNRAAKPYIDAEKTVKQSEFCWVSSAQHVSVPVSTVVCFRISNYLPYILLRILLVLSFNRPN